jgi:hypothetical protein
MNGETLTPEQREERALETIITCVLRGADEEFWQKVFKKMDETSQIETVAASEASQQKSVGLHRLVRAAQGLVDKLEKIHDDPHYKSVWFSYANHGGDYSTGPKYDKELAELKAALGLLRSPNVGDMPHLPAQEGH